MPNDIVIIGNGAVGNNIALLLDKLKQIGKVKGDVNVTILEKNDMSHMGASADAFLLHTTGYEYLKDGHQQTGIDCIEGGLAKFMMFPHEKIMAGFPLRFFLSNKTAENPATSVDKFVSNAKIMNEHYEGMFRYVMQARNMSEAELVKELLYSPDNFGREIKNLAEAVPEVRNVVAAISSAGGTFVPEADYALKRAAIAKSRVKEEFLVQTNEIRKIGDKYKIVTSDQREFEADYVVFAAGHDNTHLVDIVKEGEVNEIPLKAGTFYLNVTTQITLLSWNEYREKLRKLDFDEIEIEKKLLEVKKMVGKANFTLQQEDGCMYAPVLEPGDDSRGMAASYFPSKEQKGSQIEVHHYPGGSAPVVTPDRWKKYEQNGLPKDTEQVHKNNILNQMYRFYPALEGYIEPELCNLVVRSVFNSTDGTENIDGMQRNVRMQAPTHEVTKDGRILACNAPKWTNSEVTALTAIDNLLCKMGEEQLPKNAQFGFGPRKLDIEKLSREGLQFKDIEVSKSDSEKYCAEFASHLGHPREVVDRAIELVLRSRKRYAGSDYEASKKPRPLTSAGVGDSSRSVGYGEQMGAA